MMLGSLKHGEYGGGGEMFIAGEIPLGSFEDRMDLVSQTINSFVIRRLFLPKVPPGALFRFILFVFNVLRFEKYPLW